MTFGEFDELVTLLFSGAARWDAVQIWLTDHEIEKSIVDRCLNLPPDQAVDFLALQFNVPAAALRLLYPGHDLIVRADRAMLILQNLYRDRAQADAPPPRALVAEGKNKPKK